VPETLVEPLTDQEIDRLLQEARKHPGEHALFVLMLDTGLRASELGTLKLGDVDLENGVLKVVGGKGGKSRMVPFGTRAQKLVIDWVLHHRPDVQFESVFVDRKGVPYTRKSLRTLMRRLARRTGVTRLHSHLLRHTFATRFLESGGNAIYLKAILGHSSMRMTERYVHIVGERAAAAARQFSPMDRLADGRAGAGMTKLASLRGLTFTS
jgi:integrase/recombinase XerC/integrase/recombinase XerD